MSLRERISDKFSFAFLTILLVIAIILSYFGDRERIDNALREILVDDLYD